MLSTVVVLIDKCIDLVKRREELNRHRFTDHVEPIFQAFELVHRDYLDSFKRYREMVADPDLQMTRTHPVFERLEADRLFSEDLRMKLEGWQWEEIDFLSRLQPFTSCIQMYLESAVSHDIRRDQRLTDPPFANLTRLLCLDGLATITARPVSDEEKRTEAKELIDRLVRNLQTHYAGVLREYKMLKNVFLEPI